MSRYYRVYVETKGVNESDLGKIMSEEFGWEETSLGGDKNSYFEGEGRLCCGQLEEEAHKEISETIKKKFPKSKVRTIWTCLEELPTETYGDLI
jgi:hypothetical protein